MDELTLLQLQQLRANNLLLSGQIRESLDSFLTERWRALDSWRDADIVRLQTEILPVIAAAERQMVDLTNSHLAAVTSVSTGSAFRPAPVAYSQLTGEALRGVAPSIVFARPQMVLNWSLSKGKTLTQAIASGEDRLRSLAGTNLQLAKRNTVAKQGRARFYRRVLTGAENCAMCVIASTQRYRMGALMPIHPGCDCGEEEIIDGFPPRVIEPELLEETHLQVARFTGVSELSARDLGLNKTTAKGRPVSDYTELIITRQHGELGPVLAWRSDKFRGATEAGDLAA